MILLHRHKFFAKKPLLIIAIVLVSLSFIAAGGWLFMANQASAEYHAKLDTYKQDARAALNNAIKSFEKPADAKARQDAFNKLAMSMQQQTTNQPALPAVIGVNIASTADKDDHDAMQKALQQLAIDVNNTKSLVEYEQVIVTSLQEVSAKTGSNADEQKALAAAWQAFIDKIKALQAPKVAEEAQAKLVASATKMQVTLATLPDLYNKKDYGGFAAKHEELKAHTAEIRSLADAFKTAAEAQDQALTQSYKKAIDSLN